MPAQRIAKLSETTINQIAAGEVVESAASVVKELLENALDAAATRITLETKAGGRSLIRVTDDGSGMGREDVHLCLERHATSKIRSAEDLNALGTLGFRGEALPSIASISKLSIHTALVEGEGTFLKCEGGKILTCTSAPRRRGTTIEVASLFYNVPARKKFQKSVAHETSEIHKVLIHAALCCPEVYFTWFHDGNEQLTLGEGDRIRSLLGDAFADELIPVEGEEGDCSFKGFIGRPTAHRTNRSGTYFFINDRPVHSPSLGRALLEGYGTRLPAHRFPLCVLHFRLPQALVDVNVHPQKKEVRLAEECPIWNCLKHSVSAAFQKNSTLQPVVSFPQEKAYVFCEAVESQRVLETPESLEWTPRREFRFVRSLGRYLIVEHEESRLLLIDQLAARRRLLFEGREKGVEVQRLLFPLTLEFGPAQARLITARLEALKEIGLEIRPFGKQTFIVEALPTVLEEDQVAAFLEESDEPARALMRTLRTRALAPSEAEALAEKLFASSIPHECPQGRPTYLVLDEKLLAKMFG